MPVIFAVLVVCLLQDVSNTDAQTFSALIEKARAEYRQGNFAQSEKLLLAALAAHPSIDDVNHARTLSALGDVYVNEDKLAQAEDVYLKSLQLYEKLSDKMRSAAVLRSLGAVYSLQRRDKEA